MVGRNKRVLDIGCGPGSITKLLAQQGGCQVTGLDLDPEAIKMVTPYCTQVMQTDLDSSEWSSLFDDIKKFDVVLATDVLEHLYDPWKTLQKMAFLVNANGYLVISLPHIGHAAMISSLINGDFEYRDSGLLDRTHIRFFGLKNIEALFAQAKLKIIEIRYHTKPPEETEFAADWSRLSSTLQNELMKSKSSQVYQVVVKAVPLNRASDKVSLVPPEHKYNRISALVVALWKKRVWKRLSLERKKNIRKGLNLIGIRL
jgi:2-polyprenyl-3-methyl-5-hydroxy-6-metoxy-1,4-benzoquinol methylase